MLVVRVSFIMQSFKQLNKTYKCKQKNYNILASINLTSSQSFVLHLASMYFSWCQHFHLILFLLFSRLCMHQCPTFWLKLVDSICGLYGMYFFDYFAFNFCMMAQVFFCQIFFFLLIGIHPMQGWTATTRHEVTRKKKKHKKDYRRQKICLQRTYS